jgi:radical SAM superfamily enzyme YgiQ (UPF0313 family)
MNILLTTRLVEVEARNPIALLDLAPYMRQCGHTVDVAYMDAVPDKSYDLVGLSVLQSAGCDPVQDALCLREYGPVVVGGKWTRTMDELQKDILHRSGVTVWTEAGELLFDRTVNYETYPAWDDQDICALRRVYNEVMSNRGCPYRCNFCHNTEQKVSFFSPQRTAQNVQLLFHHGVRDVFFVNDIFTLKAAHMEQVYTALCQRGVSIAGRSTFFTHVRHVTDEVVSMMQLYAPSFVQIGIESGDDGMLQAMGKKFSVEEAFHALVRLYEARVRVVALFLIGYPAETRESLENTLQFVRKVKPYLHSIFVSYYQPVPGTVGYAVAAARRPSCVAKRNTEITYVDPNISAELLQYYWASINCAFYQ